MNTSAPSSSAPDVLSYTRPEGSTVRGRLARSSATTDTELLGRIVTPWALLRRTS